MTLLSLYDIVVHGGLELDGGKGEFVGAPLKAVNLPFNYIDSANLWGIIIQ